MPRPTLEVAELQHDLRVANTELNKALHKIARLEASNGRPRRRGPRLPAARAPLNGPRMTLATELEALDHEVLSEWDPARKIARLPRAIGREIGAALLRLDAHGYQGVAEAMAKRYSVTTEEIALCALDLSSELVSADSKEPINIILDESTEPRQD